MRGPLTDAERQFLRTEATAIFAAAVAAVDPEQLLRSHLRREASSAVIIDSQGEVRSRWNLPIMIVGAGKAAARMARTCERLLGREHTSGVVVAPATDAASGRHGDGVEIAAGGHPIPNLDGALSTRRLVETLAKSGVRPVLCLLSGGASSLMVQPRLPVTLPDKIATTELLLRCGSTIGELNTVRKHLSQVKGGGLLRALPPTCSGMAALILSDVIGDDVATIASGPTSADPTTYADAWRVICRYELEERVPASVRTLLGSGISGLQPETVKPDDPLAGRCDNLVIGSNRLALHAARSAAVARGWDTVVEHQPVNGDTTEAATNFGRRLDLESGRRVCLLAGGETTVRVRGSGTGGRNQEFALALVRALAGQRALVLSAGTDGIDGPTSAAGAFVDGRTAEQAEAQQLHPEQSLLANDSHSFFNQIGDLFVPGPTGTNVMDLKIALALGST